MIYLVLGLLLGALLLIHKALHLHPAIWMLFPLHIEMALYGWLLQFVLGVAYWIFPRFLEGARRGDPRQANLMYYLLNGGILLVLIGALFPAGGWLHFAGRLMEFGAVGLFVYLHWSRVVTYNPGK